MAGPEDHTPSPILRYFSTTHLPAGLRSVSENFAELARFVDLSLPDGSEKTVALRKILEGKDAAVRAALDAPYWKHLEDNPVGEGLTSSPRQPIAQPKETPPQ